MQDKPKDKHRWSYRGCACGCENTISLSGATLNRRNFMQGVTGAAAVAAVGVGNPQRATAQTADTAKPYRIDVHHHVSAPSYIVASSANNFGDGLMRGWTPEKSLADMDKAGVAVAMLSVTTPAVNYTSGEAARKMARECNDYAARMVADHPGRYGSFAMIPLADTDGALKEIAYAFDTLKVDGVGMMTSYGDKWLGYPELAPVFEELHRRRAVVYTHPTGANCCVNLVKGVSDAAVEYGADTTRSITSLIFSGASTKFKDV